MEVSVEKPSREGGNTHRQRKSSREGESYFLERIRGILEVDGCSEESLAATVPFTSGDVTAGSENELQAVVIGPMLRVDLPLTIKASSYFQNLLRRVEAGEYPKRIVKDLEEYLEKNPGNVWENSWVRLPRSHLTAWAGQVLERDLRADRGNPISLKRSDVENFSVVVGGEEHLRIPISYLLKLALADALSDDGSPDPVLRDFGEHLLEHFLSDNTSPETYSFYPAALSAKRGLGKDLAREMAIRFLLTQVLVLYGNKKFGLEATGQRVVVYCAPHPPVRQRLLNDLLPDALYRDLFMSPCLSGWARGEEKHRYMHLCHQVLSRSRLNTLKKLKDCRIVVNNLVTLPNTSTLSLANNGTHVSLGSLKISRLLSRDGSGFLSSDEKFIGDLVTKVVEHFLPLFVGTYTAAPYRLDYGDFHPEKALGFLPHEVDYTHLRMIWRRWKRKANISIFGHPVTPFGPRWVDLGLSRLFRLPGDFVPDFRLIDYPVALLSTDHSPALDGTLGNHERLKRDLGELGVFDPAMALYLPYRLREYLKMGFSGFEGRHYSLFEGFEHDIGGATSLQALITAMAFKYVLTGAVTHEAIPDDPTVESERRQIFFGSAIGIPTFYVRKNTRNQFLVKIFSKTENVRSSQRYRGYLRVYNREYRKALLLLLKTDGSELIRAMGLGEMLQGLEAAIVEPHKAGCAARLTEAITRQSGGKHPMRLSADEFNKEAERYYREGLRVRQMKEAMTFLAEDLDRLKCAEQHGEYLRLPFWRALMDDDDFLPAVQQEITDETASVEMLRNYIYLLLSVIHANYYYNHFVTKGGL